MFGTILFREGGDLLTSLSWALGRMHSNDATYPICSIVTDMDSNKARVLKEAGDIINELLNSEITNDKLGCDLSQFSIDQCVSQTNPILWKFLECATQTR